MPLPAPNIPPGFFLEVRDPHTLRLVCRFNPNTGEVVVIGRKGDIRRGVLPTYAVPSEADPGTELDKSTTDR